MAKMLPYYSFPPSVVLTPDRLVKSASDGNVDGIVIANSGIRAPKLIRREPSSAVFLFEEFDFEYTCSIQEGLQLMAQKQKYGADANVVFVEGTNRVHPGLLFQFENEVVHDHRYATLIEKITQLLTQVNMSSQIVPVKRPSAKETITQEMVQQAYPQMTDVSQLVPGKVYIVPYDFAQAENSNDPWQVKCYVGSYIKDGQLRHLVLPLQVVSSVCSQSWERPLSRVRGVGETLEARHCWTTDQLKASLRREPWLQLNMTLPPQAVMRKFRTVSTNGRTLEVPSILTSHQVSGREAYRCQLSHMLEGKILGKLYPTDALMPGWKDGAACLHYYGPSYNVLPLSQDLWTDLQEVTLSFKATGAGNIWAKKANFSLAVKSHYDEITNLLQMTFTITKAGRKTLIGQAVEESCIADSLAGIRAMVVRGTKKVLRMLDPIALELNLSGKVLNTNQDADWAYHSAWLSGTAIMVPSLPCDDEPNTLLRKHEYVYILTDIV